MTGTAKKAAPVRRRRTQAERTAETRKALVDAAVKTIHRSGYGGATAVIIAQEAGVSAGSIVHHFGTRADLMAEVVRSVFEQELEAYGELQQRMNIGSHLADWPGLVWEVLSRPSGMAVLEILLAARSDPKLAERIAPLQASLEQQSVARALLRWEGPGKKDILALARLIVWAIRGLSIAQVLVPDRREIERSVALFQRILVAAGDVGVVASSGRKAAPSSKVNTKATTNKR